jgi:hypothetical protein
MGFSGQFGSGKGQNTLFRRGILLQTRSEYRGSPRMKKIFVTVSGGCAYVMEDTVPQGFAVEVIDFDDIEAGDSFPSVEALAYCAEHDLYETPRPSQR